MFRLPRLVAFTLIIPEVLNMLERQASLLELWAKHGSLQSLLSFQRLKSVLKKTDGKGKASVTVYEIPKSGAARKVWQLTIKKVMTTLALQEH